MTPDGSFVVFLPGDPPRTGRFAFWHPADAVSGPDSGIVVALPGSRGPRRRRVPARTVGVAEALPLLLDPPADSSRSVRCWRDVVLTGLTLIARGRLFPAESDAGYGSWRVGPTDPAVTDWLRRCAAAMPAEAYPVPLADTGKILLHSPESLVTACWDALADTLVRTTAAYRDQPVPAFAEQQPRPVGRYAAWTATVDRELRAGVRLVLRICLPERVEEPAGIPGTTDEPGTDTASGSSFAAVLQMRSVADPSLLVDVADLWRVPEEVLSRFGADAETDVLLGLRRAARVWPALRPALAGSTPSRVELSDSDLEDLFGHPAEALAAAGVDVLWPAELSDGGPRLTAATRQPAAAAGAAFTLDDLLEFQWRATVDGVELTADEVAALAEAKRPLIRLRGKWIRVDRELVDRLRRRRGKRIGAAEALAAALTGSLEVDGERVEFRPDPALADLAERLHGLAGAEQTVPAPVGLDATLRPYQRRGLAWLAGMCAAGLGGCLADDMGLGKTIQVIALHLHRRSDHSGPTLVVCPTSLLGNWERELRRFAPDVPVRRFHGTDRELTGVADDEVVLATYGILRRDRERLARVRWGLMVADEAQNVKNPLSRTARELRAVPAAARVALTGTPVENRLTDLWSIVDWTTPGLLGPLETFRRRVAIPVERYADTEVTERLATLVRPFLLRRRKSDPGIAPELPPRTETDELVPLTAEQITLYEAVVRDTMDDIRAAEGVARRGLVLTLLTALKQICNHPAQYLGEPGPVAGRSGKLTAVEELLDVILAEGDSVLVFSQYVAMCRLLERHLADRGIQSLLVHGGVPVKQREERVRRFQAGEVPVFLLSLKAAGTGLNLTRATHVIHFDRWWNPAVEDQATDRAYRIGQDRPVQVHRLVTENTVEDRVARLIAAKRALADAVVGAGETWLTELSDAELSDLVSLGSTA